MNDTERQRLRSYQGGLLSAADEADFELRLLENPAFAEAVNLEQIFALGMQGAAIPKLDKPRAKHRAYRIAWGSIAAGVAIGFASAQFWQFSHSPLERLSAGIANPARIVFDTFRGELQPMQTQAGSANASIVIVEVAVPTDATEIYFFDGASKLGPLQPDADGFVRVLLSSQAHAADAKNTWQIAYVAAGGLKQRTLR